MIPTTEGPMGTVWPSSTLGALRSWAATGNRRPSYKDAAGITSWDSVWRT